MSISKSSSSSERRQKQTSQELVDTVHLSSESDDPMPEWIGGMQIRRKVGKGGFGIVYAAYDEGLGKEVAVKVPRAKFIPNQILIDRFIREMHAGSLDHPNILTITRAGTDNQTPYLVMPLCEGTDLGNWLADRPEGDKAQPVHLVLHWAIQLTRAVDYAHKRGVLHRDLKPSNIMLDQSSGSMDPHDWVPRLTDFGLAKALTNEGKGSSLTKHGDVLGTPEYMAPEQLAGELSEIGVATDVHGLGTILHELVYGVSPYGGHDRTNTLFKVINLAPEYPTTMKRRVPADLRAVIEKCLEKKPADRFQSASELLEELEKVRDGKPTRTRPLTLVGRGLRWGWQHPVSALAAAVIIALLATLSIGLVKFQFITHEMLQELTNINTELLRKERERALAHASSLMREAFGFLQPDRTDQALERLQHLDVKGTMPLVEGLLRHQLMKRQVVFYQGHYSWVDYMKLSADERYLLTRGRDDNVLLTDLVSGETRSLLQPEETIRRGESKHRQAVFYSDKLQLCWWSAEQNSQRLERTALPAWNAEERLSVACSEDGRRRFATHPREGVIFHDSTTGQTSQIAWPTGYTADRTQLWCSPQGDWLIIHLVGVGFLSWDVEQPNRLSPVNLVSRDNTSLPVQAITFAKHEQTLHAWVYPDEVTELRRQSLTATSRHDMKLARFSFDPHCQWDHRHVCYDEEHPQVLYLGNAEGIVVRHDLATGQQDELLNLSGSVKFLCLGASGELLVGCEQRLFAYDLKQCAITSSWQVPASLQGEQGDDFLNAISYLPSQRALLLAGSDGRIARWNLLFEDRDPLWHRERSEVHGIQFSLDSKLLATGADNGDIHLWDAATGRLLRSINKAHVEVVMSLCFTPDGQSLISGGYDGDIKQWNVATGALEHTYVGTPAKIRSIAYSAKHNRLYAGCREGFLVTWQFGQPLQCQWHRLHGNNIKSIHLSNDEERLYTGGEDYRIKCFDPVTIRELKEYRDQQESWCVVERGEYLFTAGSAAHLSVFDRQSCRRLIDLRDSYHNHNALVVSQDGAIVISAGETAPIRFWNVKTRQVVGVLYTAHEQVYKLALSPDNQYLAASCKSGKILLYPVDPLPSSK
jgi:serine/threonine protein kinase/WD40 repeat protein